ncbi:MAG: type restriction/modification system, specificity subunit [Pseudomonadota bacterium]|jgi:restriction endonuclease S subunit
MKNKYKLKDLVDIRVGLPLERKKAKLSSSEQLSYQALTLKSFGNNAHNEQLYHETFIADSAIDSRYTTAQDNVIVRLRVPNNAIYINDKHTGLLVSSIMAIIDNLYPEVLSSKFLTYYLNSQYIQNQLVKSNQGTSIIMTKIAELLELDINLPSLQQQYKIINYLELANQEINLLQQLVNEKNKLKTNIFETLIK